MAKKRDRRVAETIKFPADDMRASTASGAERKTASLLVIQGAESDLGTHVVLDRPITIGRDVEVELPLVDGSISRRHCKVEREGEHFFLRDLESTNGTRVNGDKVASKQLEDGDKIFLGDSVVKFNLADGLDVSFHSKLEELVGTDALTGLLLKRKFDHELTLELGRAISATEPVSVLVLDMDGLKQINDTYGHPLGGFVIAQVGAIVSEVVGSRGLCCRFGGDEFMCFLRQHEKEAAKVVASAIVDRVRNYKFEKDGIVVNPTISIGVAAFPEDGETVEQLFEKADQALYRAKAQGRDRVSF